MYRLLIPTLIWNQLDAHLRGSVPSEDGAFLLVRAGRGANGTRLLAHELFLPHAGVWEKHGHHQLRPSGQWLSAMIGSAIEADSGLAFVHSHPDGDHPASLSSIDAATSVEWSQSLTPSLGQPFLSLVWTPQSITGWAFEPEQPAEYDHIERVEVIGQGRSHWMHPQLDISSATDLDDRQIRTLGELGNR